jgi:hypothetical protein
MRAATFRRPVLLACVFLILTVLVAPAVAAATTFSPNRFDDPIGPGAGTNCTPPAPANGCSLRGAVSAAKAGDTIQLQAGTYKLSSAGQLKITKQLTILGAGPGATTIEAGTAGQASRVINVENGVGLTMTGVTITGGEVIGEDGAAGTVAEDKGNEGQGVDGAGIATNGPLTLTEVVVTGNTLIGGNGGAGVTSGEHTGGAGGHGGFTDGAGISAGSGLVTLNRVEITDNVAQPGNGGKGGNAGTGVGDGGAGGNSGSAGGAGISAGSGSSIVATDSLIAGNLAEAGAAGTGGVGGGISGAGGAGGQGEAANGGGLFSNGSVKLTNVTFAGNLAAGGTGGPGGKGGGTTAAEVGGAGGFGGGGQGGAVALLNGAAGQFASVTIAGNKAGGAVGGAGGVGSHGGAAGAAGSKGSTEGGNVFVSTATLSVRDTIIAGGEAEAGRENCALGGGGVLNSLGHNLEDHHQCLTKPAAGDLINTPAGLGPLAANGGPTETMALLPGSAAIDAGEAACVDAIGAPLAEDQRGDPRGTPCDIGAFEVQPVPPGEPGGPGEPSSPSGPGGDSGGGGATPGGGGSNGPKSSTPPASVTLGKLKLSPKAVRDGKKSTISFSLSAADRVTFSLQRDAPGVRAGKRCVAPRPGAPGKHCERLVAARGAPRPLSAAAAVDHLAWTPKGLPAGAYVLTATPAGGKAATLKFNVR